MYDRDDYPLPRYPEEERKSGGVGKMVLSVTLDAEGRPKELHIVKSLSPGLDKGALETVRKWKFKRLDGNPDAPLEDLQLVFVFDANCSPHF